MRPNSDIELAMNAHGDAVWRVCALHLKNKADAEDAFQETFIKYSLADGKIFESAEHMKAWLICVAQNQCRDMLRAKKRSEGPAYDEEMLDQVETTDSIPSPARIDIIDAMRALDDPPRTPLYLAMVEGYSAPEIAEMLGSPVNTIYSWIARGKKILKEALA